MALGDRLNLRPVVSGHLAAAGPPRSTAAWAAASVGVTGALESRELTSAESGEPFISKLHGKRCFSDRLKAFSLK